jgi:hypothetical protein
MNEVEAFEIYQKIKYNKIKYVEEIHCPMIIRVMADPLKGTFSAMCVEARIGEKKLYTWLEQYPLFQECYCLAKMFAREAWELRGREIAEEVNMPGTTNHKFEVWRMQGWSRYGIGKNARIRLKLNYESKPNEHYQQLLKQAADGDFTAGEIKQLMEAINVGLNTHQVFALQNEIDELKSNLALMSENSNGINSISDQGIKKED